MLQLQLIKKFGAKNLRLHDCESNEVKFSTRALPFSRNHIPLKNYEVTNALQYQKCID